MEDILKLSEGGDTYRWALANMMKCVVGCSKWGRKCHKMFLSDVATESDEGFLVLTIENNYARWRDEAKWMVDHSGNMELDDSVKANFSQALYTNSGRSRVDGRGSSKRFQGWSREGYLRFNELHRLVGMDRLRRANYELDLKKEFEKNQTKKKNVEDSDGEGEEIFPANDLEGIKRYGVDPMVGNKNGDSGDENSSDEEDNKENNGYDSEGTGASQ